MLERISEFKNLCRDILTLQAPATLYWLVALVWISGAMFGRWFL